MSLECGGKSCDAVWSFCDFKGISAKQGAELEDHGIPLDASEKLFTPTIENKFPNKSSLLIEFTTATFQCIILSV